MITVNLDNCDNGIEYIFIFSNNGHSRSFSSILMAQEVQKYIHFRFFGLQRYKYDEDIQDDAHLHSFQKLKHEPYIIYVTNYFE